MGDQPAIACNLCAFSDSQIERYGELLAALGALAGGARELAAGYEVTFPMDAETAMRVVEFVTLERLCCPFLTFTIELAPGNELSLRLTGPDGAKQILSEFAWVSAHLPARRSS